MNRVLLNRKEAGCKLAEKLNTYFNHPQALVLGLPRGGVPVAYEIAKSLHLPLDVCLVKKLGLPQNPEVAVGAVAEEALLHNYSGDITIIDRNTAQMHGVEEEKIQAIAAQVKAELRWRDNCYRQCRPMIPISGRVVIVVDDGIATGLTMHAAVKVLQQHQPERIIIATTVAAISALQQLKPEVDEIICLLKPRYFNAVSLWYEDFPQITDQEVCDLLSQETQMESVVERNGHLPLQKSEVSGRGISRRAMRSESFREASPLGRNVDTEVGSSIYA
ncbi:Phosphoribosyltransferase [Hyella patelloides LEGE 07179]|uniref:Phosphoribosyltransferase n=1 Tax=Hyella patelloides LEGE 07179 TaxID=945734 RepID=A0A563W4S0_9CYAN|nr:phosphoribosyltransferase family protein [Hyella patelloides]VEP18637.1 Phosphoribosyltransferase [Hyella patelloides LEGE 07179]